MSMQNKDTAPVMALNGIGAIFARGFMEMYATKERRLRECQEAGMAAVVELGETISVPYISKISRMLVEAGIVGREKVGRKFYVTDAPHLNDFLDFLEESADYGTRMRGTQDDDRARLAVFEHLEEHGSVRSTGEQRIPKAAYKMLMQQVQSGELDIVIVKTGLVGGFKYNGATHKSVPADA